MRAVDSKSLKGNNLSYCSGNELGVDGIFRAPIRNAKDYSCVQSRRTYDYRPIRIDLAIFCFLFALRDGSSVLLFCAHFPSLQCVSSLDLE